MSTDLEICNLAVQQLGAYRIASLAEGTPQARACALAYAPVKLAELQDNAWRFAIKRVSITADVSPPATDEFGYAFTPPADYLRPILLHTDYTDWSFEGGKILSNDAGPIKLRYVSGTVAESLFDPLFVIAFSTRMAEHMCEQITQSNQKKADLAALYKRTLARARRANALFRGPQYTPEDSWISVRR